MNRLTIRISIFAIVFTALWLIPQSVVAAATTITSFNPGSSSVGRYQKYEATFSISRTFPVLPDFAYPDKYDQAKQAMLPYYYYDASDTPTTFPNRKSPYGVDGITINAIFLSPSGKQLTLPAFYYQSYSRSGDVMTPGSTYNWKLRFAPAEIGTYSYTISIQDKNGSSTYPVNGSLSFQTTSSISKGNIRVSMADSRYFEFSDQTSFIQLGYGRQWYLNAQTARVSNIESTFASWKTSGINTTRIWDQNDGYSLTTEGHFDGYQDSTTPNWYDNRNPQDNYNAGRGDKYNPLNLAQGTQINQRGAFEQDLIFQSAETNGVYIQLCSHEDPYWLWDADIHEDGRTLTNTEHMNYWKRNYRYRVARWSYSTALLGWEAWNEHYPKSDNTVDLNDYYNFYQQWATFVKNIDPHDHLVTTSLGSQKNIPNLWSSTTIGLDYANYHDYLRTNYGSLRNDEALFVYRFSWCLVSSLDCGSLGVEGSNWGNAKKPWIWGEIDVANSNIAQQWTDPDPKVIDGEPRVRFLHNTTWAGLFSPMGVSPLDWYWDRQTQAQTNTDRLTDRKATANFFNGVDMSHAQFTHFMTTTDKSAAYSGETITVNNDPNGKTRVLGMRRSDKKAAYFWVQHRDYTWYHSPTIPSSINPTIIISNLLNESYKIEVWNTHTPTNQIVSTQQITPTNGTINLALANLSTDLAVKVESSSIPPPSVPGDLNNDTRIDFRDILTLMANFRQYTILTFNQIVRNY